MKTQTLLSEEINVRRAVGALFAALGPVETLRFMTLPRHRRIESVRRHRKWQATLNREIFLERVFGARSKR